MNQSLLSSRPSAILFPALGSILCLTLLINVSYKIVHWGGLTFAINSLICPLTAGFYYLTLRYCSIKEQRHLLNIALMTLYIFCIGVYVLVTLPAAEFMHGNPAYQIVFDDIPKKFFAVTIAFALSFYLPHLIFYNTSPNLTPSCKKGLLLALLGGFGFFLLTFLLLFSGSHFLNLPKILLDSTLVASSLLLSIALLCFLISSKTSAVSAACINRDLFPLYDYLVCFAAVIMLICLACEYRLVAFGGTVLAASSLFFPLTLLVSNLIGELWGYRPNLKFSLIIIGVQVLFDLLLMGIIALPSPDFYKLNSFYHFLMIRRLPATFLTLFATYLSNAMLLHYLKQQNIQWPVRILLANLCANSLLCLIDYILLFGGIYPYEQIISLVLNVWEYKFIMSLILLPLVLKLYARLQRNKFGTLPVSTNQ